MLNRRTLIVATGAAIASACDRQPEDASRNDAGAIRLAILRSSGPSSEDNLWSPLLSDLRTATGLNGKIALFDSAAALVEAMRRQHADLALMPSATALAAVRRANTEVFAQARMIAPDDAAFLVVGPRSRLTVDRILLCDRKLRLGLAAGGRNEALYAADAFLFAPRGVGPARCFRDVRRAQPPALFSDLSDSRLDVAIIEQSQITADRGDNAGSLRILWRSPPLPSPSLIWRRDLDPAIKEKLRQFFLTYGHDDPAERTRLAALGLAGFTPTDDSHLLIERELDAAHVWLEARAGGDKAKAERAKSALDAITAERRDLEARTGTPAGEQ